MTNTDNSPSQSIANIFRSFEDKVNSAVSQINGILNGLRTELFGQQPVKRRGRPAKVVPVVAATTAVASAVRRKDPRSNTTDQETTKNLRATTRALGFPLKATRKTAKQSMKQLAEATGISQSTLWRFEAGQAVPSQDYATRLQTVLSGMATTVVRDGKVVKSSRMPIEQAQHDQNDWGV